MRVEIIREDVTYLAEEVSEVALVHPVIGEVALRGYACEEPVNENPFEESYGD